MSRSGALAAAIILLGACSGASAQQAQGTPGIGRCHMEECSWSVIRGRDLVGQAAAGSLYRLSVMGGTSRHPDENYPESSRDVRIEWNAAPHEVFIFCSRRLPSAITATGGGLQVDVLDFVNGPPGILESSANHYVRTCHPGDDWASDGFAARFGYEARADDAPEIDLNRPEDIFELAR